MFLLIKFYWDTVIYPQLMVYVYFCIQWSELGNWDRHQMALKLYKSYSLTHPRKCGLTPRLGNWESMLGIKPRSLQILSNCFNYELQALVYFCSRQGPELVILLPQPLEC